jgi:hypothetical protein
MIDIKQLVKLIYKLSALGTIKEKDIFFFYIAVSLYIYMFVSARIFQ